MQVLINLEKEDIKLCKLIVDNYSNNSSTIEDAVIYGILSQISEEDIKDKESI